MTNICLVVQEEKLKRPLSHMEAWEIAHTQKDSKRAQVLRQEDRTEEEGLL